MTLLNADAHDLHRIFEAGRHEKIRAPLREHPPVRGHAGVPTAASSAFCLTANSIEYCGVLPICRNARQSNALFFYSSLGKEEAGNKRQIVQHRILKDAA
jgi:hypothetical protein